jgi:hypothetical protein
MSTIKFSDMTSGSFTFLWEKAVEGYQLEDESKYELVSKLIPSICKSGPAKPDVPPWLVPKGEMLQRYAPLKIRVLHRKFAQLTDESSMRKFADHYGLLGDSVSLAPPGGGTLVYGESLELWHRESSDLGILLAIWDMVWNQDAGKLGQIIVWPSNNTVILQMKARFDGKSKTWTTLKYGDGKPAKDTRVFEMRLASRGKAQVNPDLLDRWKMGDSIEPARYYVCMKVNQHLKGHISPQVLPFFENKVYLIPDSLLSAMWLMLFDEITGILKLRRCDNCGEWKPMLKKRKTFYCSARCRQAKYRNRTQKQKGGKP